MNTNTEPITIQQVAAATGLSVHTLRYYERIGLIHPINRAGNTHRRYTTDDIGWIEFLSRIDELREHLKLIRYKIEVYQEIVSEKTAER